MYLTSTDAVIRSRGVFLIILQTFYSKYQSLSDYEALTQTRYWHIDTSNNLRKLQNWK